MILRVLLLVWLTAGAAAAAEPAFPALSGRVVDQAGLIGAQAEARLTEMLAAHEQKTRQQVVVATVRGLDGLPIEEYGYRLGRTWGIGERGRDTGAILLVAPQERAVRIEVGYGLEGLLTDAASRTIIDRDILPAFREGRFEAGIMAGATAMLQVLGGNAEAAGEAWRPPPAAEEGGPLPILAVILLILLFAYLSWRHPRLAAAIIFSSGGGRSSGGGGGFSGGGGSFGGGGASGRW